MSEYINEVDKIVLWYKELPRDYSNIDDLMYARQKLCGYLYLLSVELGKARTQWKQDEFTVENIRRRSFAEFIAEGMPFNKAQEFSKIECLEEQLQEKKSDSYYYSIKFVIDSAQEVNNTIMQHISWLKKEHDGTKLEV